MANLPQKQENYNIEDFQQDSKTLGICTDEFVQNFYPSYGMDSNKIEYLQKEDSLEILNSFCFFKLCECTVDNIENLFQFFANKMQKLFTAAYSMKQKICYGIVSSRSDVALVIGFPNEENGVAMRIIEGLLPGMKVEKFQCGFQNCEIENSAGNMPLNKDRYLGWISGVPALKVNGIIQNKDISSLLRSLNGENYTVMVLCQPLDEKDIYEKIGKAIEIKDKCFAISKRTISLQQGSSHSKTATGTNSVSDAANNSTTNGINVSGTLPLAVAGAAIGSMAIPIPVVGSAVGGLIGLIVGTQFGFNRSKTKGSSHTETKSFSNAVTEAISKNESVAGDVQNGFAIELMKMADTMEERLKTGRSIGMWKSIVTYSSDSELTRKIIQGGLYSEIASGIPEILPPVVFQDEDSCRDENEDNVEENCQHLLIPKDFFDDSKSSSLWSLVTSEELCGICTIPIDNTVGFQIRKAKGYSINNHKNSNDIPIGNVCEFERTVPNAEFGLSENDLNKHTFVCGITGSGKTNTVKGILKKLKKPFMVIEPAKKEYRNLGNLDREQKIYTLGRPEINCLKINPFYVMPGISPQQHVDYLKDLFCASFALYGPMPYILEKCLYNIYTKKGWDLTLGFHPLLAGKDISDFFNEKVIKDKYSVTAHKYLFPTMQDLKDEVDSYIENELAYEGDVKGNIRSAIKARIDSLCVGSKGYMFNTHEITDFDVLFSENVVLELEGLADDADKAFSLGLLIVYLNEYRQVKNELEKVNGLQHVLVIEEAHRLLKNVSQEINEEIGNPKGKAVEHFANMLAEMRSYGQGIIVAEQIPCKLAPDIIKNTSNKIIHRIVAKDDQDIVANAVGIETNDAIYIGNLRTGYALCHKEGMVEPVTVNVLENISDKHVKDDPLFTDNVETKFFEINKSIICNQFSKCVSVWAVKALVSLMCKIDAEKFYCGIEQANEDLLDKIMLNAVTMVPTKSKKACIVSSIVDAVVSLLVYGVFSNHQLPSNELVELIANTFNAPTNEKIQSLYELFTSFYRKNPKNKSVEIVSALLSAEYSKGYDIDKMIEDFMLFKDASFVNDVKEKLQ